MAASVHKTTLVAFGLLGTLLTVSPAAAVVYTFTEGSAADAVGNFSFTTSMSGAQLNNLAPGTDITGSVTSFTFLVNVTASQAQLGLSQDLAGFPIGVNNPSGSAAVMIGTNAIGQITSWSISEPYFASYSPFVGENPNDFFGNYTVTTTNSGDTVTLTLDHDAGFAPLSYTTGTGSFGALAAVPEPSTWAMMLIGFLALGVTAYRRRSQAVFDAA